MKGFFKKHPELLILLVIVIIIDGVLVWMWLGDLAATEKSKQSHEKLKNDAKAINASKWRISNANAQKAKDELAKYENSFEELVGQQLEKYQFSVAYDKGASAPAHKVNINRQVSKLSEQLLKDKDKTQDKLSFFTYAYENTVLDMKPEEIETVYVILKGLEELINICVKADVISVDQVQRPNELAFFEDKQIFLKKYTYILTLSVTSESLKKLLNEVVNNEKFFFEINSIKVNAVQQITASTSDLVPLVGRQGAGNQGAKAAAPRGIEGLEESLRIGDPVSKKAEDSDEPIIYKDSISPFSQAVNKVEISIDWVQFVKEAK